MKSRILLIYNFVILLLVLGLYLGYTSMLLCIAMMLIRLLWCNKREVAVFMLFMGMPCLGFIFQTFHLPIPGSLIALAIGVSLSFSDVSKHCLKHMQSVWLLLAFFLLFSIFYYIGPRHAYATSKLLEIFQTGIATFFSFVLLCNYKGVNMKTISQLFIIYGLIMMSGALNYFGFSPPSGIFDFNFIRDTVEASIRMNERSLIDYQHIGMAFLTGCAFRLSVERKFSIELLFFAALSFWLTLMAGARQAIFGVPIILTFWAFVKSDEFKIRQLIVVAVAVFSLYYVFHLIGANFIQNSLDTSLDIKTRIGGRDYIRAFVLFLSNPILGTGLGGFYNPSLLTQSYPHNIILELLSECGLMGLFLCLFMTITYLRKYRVGLHYTLPNNALFFIIWMAFMIRSMISGDLGDSIVIFTSIIAIYVPNKMAAELIIADK
jgi:O-antigen ligase